MVESKLNRRKGITQKDGGSFTRNILCVLFVIILLVLTALTTTIVTIKEASKSHDKTEQQNLREVLARPDRDDEEIKVEAVENNLIEIEEEGADGKSKLFNIGLLILMIEGYGNVDIELRPDLSKDSVDYIYRMVQAKVCADCFISVAEPKNEGILKGFAQTGDEELSEETRPDKIKKGGCPYSAKELPTGCPENVSDEVCACHGPLMEYGMVGWVDGGTGPEFFINNYKDKEASEKFGTHTTIFGQVVGSRSFAELNKLTELPKKAGTQYELLNHLPYTMQLIE